DDHALGTERRGDLRGPEVVEATSRLGHVRHATTSVRRATRAADMMAAVSDVDAIVVGAGHNGLVTAAYLAKAGRRTLVLEARDQVGGTAGSEAFAGATVN